MQSRQRGVLAHDRRFLRACSVRLLRAGVSPPRKSRPRHEAPVPPRFGSLHFTRRSEQGVWSPLSQRPANAPD
jgi:hypothetical protein